MAEPLHILVVEDDHDTRDSLCELFQFHGYRTSTAASAADARTRFQLRVPDIVILDAGLPDSSGFDLAREIKDDYAAIAPTIIVFTGYPGLEAAAHAAGCDAFVLKPSTEPLLRAVASAADECRGRSVSPPARMAEKGK
jgi:CheY-like chemotaxis protein